MQEKNPEAEIEGYAHKKKRLKQNKMENSQCKLRVAVDCSFDALMDDNGEGKPVTWGNNIVAGGWAGTYNRLSFSRAASKMRVFTLTIVPPIFLV